MLKIIKEKNVWRLIFFRILLIILNKRILCNNNIACFEYSCEECNSPEYGNCTKCRYGWTLIDGTCPCFSPSCAVCTTGFFGSDLCQLCKKGYVWDIVGNMVAWFVNLAIFIIIQQMNAKK